MTQVPPPRDLTVLQVILIDTCMFDRKLQHPNIVKFYGSVFRTTSDEQVHAYIVMELCKTSLRSHIFDNPQQNAPSTSSQATAQAFSWLKGIVCAVIHIHRKGYVHRDLKLDNILVCHGTKNRTCEIKIHPFYWVKLLHE